MILTRCQTPKNKNLSKEIKIKIVTDDLKNTGGAMGVNYTKNL